MIQSVFLFATFVTGGWWLGNSKLSHRHFERMREIFVIRGKRVMRETRKRETCYPKAFGHRHDLYSAALVCCRFSHAYKNVTGDFKQ